MSEQTLRERKRVADVIQDLRVRHERLLDLILTDEETHGGYNEELRADLGILLHVAIHGAAHVPFRRF